MYYLPTHDVRTHPQTAGYEGHNGEDDGEDGLHFPVIVCKFSLSVQSQ
jgi:hypothetical protein